MEPIITIKNLELHVGYDFEQNHCQICRKSLMAPPLTELKNKEKTQIGMAVTLGKCGHIFHKECIGEVSKTYQSCPIPTCNLVWRVDEFLTSDISVRK